jgi:hypothetical protein
MVGFDHDDASIFDAQIQFVAEARIVTVMLGMVSAIPKTPLYDRLAAEGRLDTADESEFGTNIIPLLLDREALRDGFVRLMGSLYDPEQYLDRLDDLFVHFRLDFSRRANQHWRQHRWRYATVKGRFLVQALGLLARLSRRIPDPRLRREYMRRIWRLVQVRRDPGVLWIYVVKCLLHYHAHTMAQGMVERGSHVINTY